MRRDDWILLCAAVLIVAVTVAVLWSLWSPLFSMCDAQFVDGTVTQIPC